MGGAIAGINYTGMAAASFIAEPARKVHGLVIGQHAIDGTMMFFAGLCVLMFVVVVATIDRHVSRQQHLITDQQRYLQTIVSTAPVVLIAVDADGKVVIAEGRDLPALGHRSEAMIGRRFCDIFAAEPELVAHAARALAGESHAADVTVRGIELDLRWTARRDAAGCVSSVIAVATDVTDRCNAERTLRDRSLHDPLTGLPNRAAMSERLPAMLAGAHARNANFALALIDLDRFKEVNDTLGHALGDELLASAARRIDATLTTLAITGGAFRIGGDEFALFLPDLEAADAADIAQLLLRELAQPHDIAEYTLDVHASIGIALFPAQAPDEQTLLRCADVAMYVAKRAGLGYALYDAGHDRHSKTLLALEADMRRAIDDGGFELHYQPQMDMATGRVVATEALLRWHHPTLGMLAPDRFIPIAEETGLIAPLTDWVVEEALRQLAVWSAAGYNMTMAVNVSMRNLRDSAFTDMVAAALERHRIPPARLVIEVTETIIMVDDERTRSAFERLAALGIVLSIDDFGTGYSSLTYLRRLPVRELKIDKSFVLGLADADSKDAELVRLIVDLGHNLELRVVAEGVENQDVLDILAALGCDIAQGYYISRPMAAAMFENWLTSAGPVALSSAA